MRRGAWEGTGRTWGGNIPASILLGRRWERLGTATDATHVERRAWRENDTREGARAGRRAAARGRSEPGGSLVGDSISDSTGAGSATAGAGNANSIASRLASLASSCSACGWTSAAGVAGLRPAGMQGRLDGVRVVAPCLVQLVAGRVRPCGTGAAGRDQVRGQPQQHHRRAPAGAPTAIRGCLGDSTWSSAAFRASRRQRGPGAGLLRGRRRRRSPPRGITRVSWTSFRRTRCEPRPRGRAPGTRPRRSPRPRGCRWRASCSRRGSS